jgi:aspartate 1-decarboxylase
VNLKYYLETFKNICEKVLSNFLSVEGAGGRNCSAGQAFIILNYKEVNPFIIFIKSERKIQINPRMTELKYTYLY